MPFPDHLAALDAAIRDTLSDGEGRVLDESGQVIAATAHPILEQPKELDTLRDGQVARARPTIELSIEEVPRLKAGYMVELGGRRYKVQGAPTRPGDGRWWLADVQDLGPLG